jgi:chemotaxis protein MotC
MRQSRRRHAALLSSFALFAASSAQAGDPHGGHGDAGHAPAAAAAPAYLLSAPPARRDGDLADLVRDLNAVQNRVVMGDPAARAASLKRFEIVERAVQELPIEEWKLQNNVRAAATYLLCGGSARTLHKLFAAQTFAGDDAVLIGASLAYAEGRRQDAQRQFATLDPRQFPETLGGHIALVLGGLHLGEDNERARKMFDLARLLVPGSIVEEAALRRQISIVDAGAEPEKATLLLRRYVSRYLKSPYARNFWDDLAATIFRVSAQLPPEKFALLQDLFAAAPPPRNFDLHLGLTRVALLAGTMERARVYLDKAAPLADSPTARSRVDLYEGAYRAMLGDFAEGLAAMSKIDSNTLPPNDQQFLRIVAATVMRLQMPAPESLAPQTSSSAADTPTVVVAARDALEQSDLVLKKAMR